MNLERHLIAQPREASAIRRRVQAFYDSDSVESPGVDATDYVKALDLD